MNTPNPPRLLKIAVIQHAPVFLNLEESLEKACVLIEQAASQGAELIVFPETWLPGYPVWLDYAPRAALWDYPPAKALYRLLAENAVTVPGSHLGKLLTAAQKTGTYIVMGVHERRGGTLYNTMIHIDRDGKNFQVHRKLMPTYTERMVWGRGDGSTLSVLDTAYGTLGGLICWEHWMPLARAAMHAKHETIHVAQWPMVKELHQLASRHYAFEGQCFVIAAGCVLSRGDIIAGFHSLSQPDNAALELLESMPADKAPSEWRHPGEAEDLIMRGGSAVIAPDAEYVTGPVLDESCIIYAEIEPARVTEGNLLLDTAGHYARPDVFQLTVDGRPQLDVAFKSDGDPA